MARKDGQTGVEGTTLYAQDGTRIVTDHPQEITRLRARGYTDTKPKPEDRVPLVEIPDGGPLA